MKRRSTRHVSEVTAIPTEFGNSAKIIVPRSWLGRRVIAPIFTYFYRSYGFHRSFYGSMIDSQEFNKFFINYSLIPF